MRRFKKQVKHFLDGCDERIDNDKSSNGCTYGSRATAWNGVSPVGARASLVVLRRGQSTLVKPITTGREGEPVVGQTGVRVQE